MWLVQAMWTMQCQCFRLMATSSSLYDVSHSGSCEHLVHFTKSVIQANLKFSLTLQYQWFRLMSTSSSLYNVSDSRKLEGIVNIAMSVIQVHVNVWLTLQYHWFRLMWTLSSLYKVSDSDWCEHQVHKAIGNDSGCSEHLVHFTVSMIKANMHV